MQIQTLAGGALLTVTVSACLAYVVRTRKWVEQCSEVEGFVASDWRARRNQKYALGLAKFTAPSGEERAINFGGGKGWEKGDPIKVLVHPSGKAVVNSLRELYGVLFILGMLGLMAGFLLLMPSGKH